MSSITYRECLLCNSKNISLFINCKDYFITQEHFDLYKCEDCQFIFTQGVPTEGNIEKYYKSENYISHSNTKTGLINRLYHISRLFMLFRKRKLIEKRCKANYERILDIGSGTGHFLNYMKKNKWDVLGVEKNYEAKHFSTKNFNLNILSMEQFFSQPIEPFVIITMWHVLEHLHSPEKYLDRVYELLKDDGLLIIALPNYTSFDASYYKNFWAGYDTPRHLWHFSPKALEVLVHKHNFRVISKKRMPLDAFYVSIISEKYKDNNFAIVLGLIIGFISLIKSLIDIDKCSSIIYIFSKSQS